MRAPPPASRLRGVLTPIAALAHALVLSLAQGGCARTPENREPFAAQVLLDLSGTKPARPAERLLLGNNLQWVDRGDELLERGSPDFSPRMIELARGLGPTVLRYPGGCLADTYHWKNGVGPRARRAPNERFFDRRRERIELGTVEFLSLCRDLGAEPMVTVNTATGTPEEAAEWVAFCNGGVADAAGKPLPTVRLWEVGNEPYLTNEQRKELAIAPADFARRADLFIAAMKKVDPSIQILVPLRSDKIGALPATPHQGYNRTVLRSIASPIDYVALHNAYLPACFGGAPGERELFAALMAAPRVVADDIAQTRALLAELRPGQPIGIAVTEYNSLFTIGRSSDGFVTSPASAVYLADLVRVFAENSVAIANYWSLTGNWFFGAISPRGAVRPAYRVLERANELLRGALVPVTVTSPTFAAPSVGFVPPLEGNPLLTALATREGNVLCVLLINKDRTRPARVDLSGNDGTKLESGTILRWGGGGEPFSATGLLDKAEAPPWMEESSFSDRGFPLTFAVPASGLAFARLHLAQQSAP